MKEMLDPSLIGDIKTCRYDNPEKQKQLEKVLAKREKSILIPI